MTLIEKAERQFDQDEAQELERKMRRDEFTLDDFLASSSRSGAWGRCRTCSA